MQKPLVSIVSLLYEIKTEYVNECIDSLLKQTYDNIEIIFINDCSPKTNYDYITKLSPKIKLIKNEVNLGMNRTAQKAFESANGKYVVRIDSDDYIAPTLIEKEVRVLESNPLVGAVCCELQRFGRRSQHIRRPLVWSLPKILAGNINGCGYAGGMMFRKDLLSKISINPNYKMCEDLDFHIQILENMQIRSIHEILYYYRSHDTNLCKSVSNKERININKTILATHKRIFSLKSGNPIKLQKKNKFF